MTTLRDQILDILAYADPQHPRTHWRHKEAAAQLEELFFEVADMPVVACPQCGKKDLDYDGFGVIYCEPPEGCGYCLHLSDSFVKGHWACDYCGATQIEGERKGEVSHKREKEDE